MKVKDIIPLTEKMVVGTGWAKYKDNPFDSDAKLLKDTVKKGVKKVAKKVMDKVRGKKD